MMREQDGRNHDGPTKKFARERFHESCILMDYLPGNFIMISIEPDVRT